MNRQDRDTGAEMRVTERTEEADSRYKVIRKRDCFTNKVTE